MNEVDDLLPGTVSQRPVWDEPLAAQTGKAKGTGRFRVSITSFRKRLIDPDNLCAKALVDCCRYAGLIPADTPDCIDYSIRQTKIRKGEEERTEVEITLIG